METIVVGFIDSPTGQAALDAAVIEARLRNAHLSVVTSARGGTHEHAEEATSAEETLERVAADLVEMGIDHEIHHLVRGMSPSEDLTEHASRMGASLIVIGYRRRTPAGKFILGSDSRDVLLSAPCPVLCVRADDEL
ncbi:universal stress protein [bacterium]|nr:universal stress protein [bacterium]